jgi:hypothetical protein
LLTVHAGIRVVTGFDVVEGAQPHQATVAAFQDLQRGMIAHRAFALAET